MTEADFKEEVCLLNKDLGVILSPNSENLKEVIYIHIIKIFGSVQYTIMKLNFNFQTFEGFTQVVNWLVDHVKNPKLFVAENGISEKPNEDGSALKIEYHHVSCTAGYSL